MMKRLLLKWLCVNSATLENIMNLEILFKPETYIKRPLPEFIFTPELADTFNEDMFLDLFKTDYFFMVFLLPFTEIDKFLHKVGFKQKEKSLYRNSIGFSLTLSVHLSKKHKTCYYLSTLNYPKMAKRMSFDLDFYNRIDVAYKNQDKIYSSDEYSIDFRSMVNMQKGSNNITSIHHNSDLFNLNHEELHTKDSLKSFADKLDYNIHRIEEEQLLSIMIDEKVYTNVSLFDVVYVIGSDESRVRSFMLSDIIQICGFSFDRMIGKSMEQFMNIENIFDKDELKVIEMTYI